jgi:hypothetical protein
MKIASEVPAASVRQVPVVARSPIGSGRYDYADAFELRLREPDSRTAEELARLALEEAPWAVRRLVVFAWRRILRFRLGPRSSPGHVLGARVVRSEPDVIQLDVSGPIMRGVIVSRKTAPTCIVVTTYVVYERPSLARIAWTIAAPLHRWVARYLLTRTATHAQREDHG